MASAQEAESKSRTAAPGGWLRQYPPLTAFVVAILIMAVLMPSALNLPQANPQQVLEYAPVPPDKDSPPESTEGNISSLGLGGSSSLSTGFNPNPRIAGPGGKGIKPVTKKCVGKPARQTEDPNAPPCVPFFDGDNGGATWQGVFDDEIIVLVYRSASISVGGDEGTETTPASGTYCDVDKPPNSEQNCLRETPAGQGQKVIKDHTEVRVIRALSRYFNDRFQTYGRHVHFFIYWSPSAATPSSRRADAADNWQRLKPFAVIDRAFFGGYNAVYAEAMVLRRVMLFGAYTMLPAKYYADFSPMIWGFWPDVEHTVDMYVSYVCNKVAGFPVKNSGNGDAGQERRYAFLSTTDPNFAGLQHFAKLAKEGLQNCPNGQKLNVVEPNVTYSRNQYQVDTHPDATTESRSNVARMKGNSVTTVLWLGGYDGAHSVSAKDASWFPEWVIAGDQLNDGIANARAQQQDVWRHAWGISNFLREDRLADQPCRQAFRESEPQGTNSDEDETCIAYRGVFMLFKSIQVAGPYLAPDTVDAGQHAIPKQKSSSPYIAACYYDPADSTCVKDANEIWWDPDAADPGGDPSLRGCYRLVHNGERFPANTWPRVDEVFTNRADPCNNVDTDSFVNPYGPAG
jgi:hypothetical protein